MEKLGFTACYFMTYRGRRQGEGLTSRSRRTPQKARRRST
jgi:hypothetical protein